MDKLFTKLARGDMPNVIELMSAISELSNLYPGCQDCEIQVKNPIKYSVKTKLEKHTSKYKSEKIQYSRMNNRR